MDIRISLGLNNTQYGSLGSVVFAGLTAGSIVAPILYGQYNTKTILTFALIMNCLAMVLFTQTTNLTLLLLSRFLTGFFQVFVTIFFPVWADTFGSSDKEKSLWLTVLMLAAVIGVVCGYILTTYCIQKYTW